MTSRRRGRPSIAPASVPVPATPEFVSGELFDFKSPKGVMTRLFSTWYIMQNSVKLWFKMSLERVVRPFMGPRSRLPRCPPGG